MTAGILGTAHVVSQTTENLSSPFPEGLLKPAITVGLLLFLVQYPAGLLAVGLALATRYLAPRTQSNEPPG
jgi:hypothetical protein